MKKIAIFSISIIFILAVVISSCGSDLQSNIGTISEESSNSDFNNEQSEMNSHKLYLDESIEEIEFIKCSHMFRSFFGEGSSSSLILSELKMMKCK